MELLKQRILQDGRCYPGGILKVDSFINHQMDPMLMYKIAEEFIRRFQDRKINKIVTIEASGIAPAIMVGYIMQLPVVFVKKKKPKTMENMLSTVVHSFTKDRDYTVCISNNWKRRKNLSLKFSQMKKTSSTRPLTRVFVSLEKWKMR